MTFLPADFPSLEIPPGLGLITMDRRDRAASLNEREKAALSLSFRAAYIDGLLREAPLAGILGGDLVHGWSANNPNDWVQNWRTSAPEANSWGIPQLILAVRGGETSGERVFMVQGKILDHYGKSAGRNNANGNAGYGSPRGYEFLYKGKLAQRFDFGLITVDGEGKGAFLPEAPPSLELNEAADIEVNPIGAFVYVPSAAAVGADIRSAFVTAWKMALDRGVETMTCDGSGQYLLFVNDAWDLSGVEALKGLYIQTFNRRTIALVLPDSPLLPPYPRFIASPFLEVLLAPSRPVSGAETLKPLDIKFSGGDDFSRALMRGLALYGIPLTDPMPAAEGAEAAEEGKAAVWREFQRFSRGWLSVPIASEP